MRTVNIAISNCIDCPYSEIRADYKETRGWPSYENKMFFVGWLTLGN
jgi:hypothetical protein